MYQLEFSIAGATGHSNALGLQLRAQSLYFHLSPVSSPVFLLAPSFDALCTAEMYPGFQIMGCSGPLLEKFGGPLQSFGGPANS